MSNIKLDSRFFDFQIFVKNTPQNCPILTGDPSKGLLIVVNEDDFTPENQVLLTKIMAAVGFDLTKEVFLLQLDAGNDVSWTTLEAEHELKQVLFFGIDLATLGLHCHLPNNVPIDYRGIQMLHSDQLSAISSDKSRKAALWNALKMMFLQKK